MEEEGAVIEVFLLWHVHELPDGEDDEKLIGVYASFQHAEAAKHRALQQPGFRDCPQGFHIDPYRLGEDHWNEGYVTIIPQGKHQDD